MHISVNTDIIEQFEVTHQAVGNLAISGVAVMVGVKMIIEKDGVALKNFSPFPEKAIQA